VNFPTLWARVRVTYVVQMVISGVGGKFPGRQKSCLHCAWLRCSYRKRPGWRRLHRRRPARRRRNDHSADVVQPARRRAVQLPQYHHRRQYSVQPGAAVAVRRRAVSALRRLRRRLRRRLLLLPPLRHGRSTAPAAADRLHFRLRASRDPSLVRPAAAAHGPVLLRRAADRGRGEQVRGLRTPRVAAALRGELEALLTSSPPVRLTQGRI